MAEHDCESIRDLEREALKRKRLGHVLIGPGAKRPKKRSDCIDGPRPCPWVGCKYHLFLDVKDTGSIVYRASSDVEELRTMPYSCALDAAEVGGMKLHEVGAALNISRERVRQHEEVCKRIIRVKGRPHLQDFIDAEIEPEASEHAQDKVTGEANCRAPRPLRNVENLRLTNHMGG